MTISDLLIYLSYACIIIALALFGLAAAERLGVHVPEVTIPALHEEPASAPTPTVTLAKGAIARAVNVTNVTVPL